MTSSEPIYDSPTGWVADHIRKYVDTNGAKGHIWRGMPTLLLTTRGRKTGKLRRTALIYGKDQGRYVVVASNGAARNNPEWYLNLCTNPEVLIQVGAEHFAAVARDATAEERPHLFEIMAKIFPTYNDYEKKTKRNIPVVVIERKGTQDAP
jgi:deazaflavin-dependent oxidoreductase (nitroreductase family)